MKKALILCLFYFPFLAIANITLPDNIADSQHLSLDGSPYLIEKDLTIDEGVSLIIESGVVLYLNEGCRINNNGRFIINGSSTFPVIFKSSIAGKRWGWINNSGTLMMSHVISSESKRFVSCQGDSLVLNSCKIFETTGNVAGYDAIGAHYTPYVRILNCKINGDPTDSRIDAIDLDGVNDVLIDNNTIRNFSDDAIDIGTHSNDVLITNNRFINCDIGISVGETSTVSAAHNLIVECTFGVQSHTGSILKLDFCTLYNNSYGVKAYHYDSQKTSTGTAHITNSILSKCNTGVDRQFPGSVISYDYCLSDSMLDGGSNYLGNASFTNPKLENFYLTTSSIARDKANPDGDNDNSDFLTDGDDQDADGTRRDLGFAYVDQSPLQINEISSSNLNCHKDENDDYDDWIEIINTSEESINLKGYYLTDDDELYSKHEISKDLIIDAHSTLVLWADNESLELPNHLSFALDGDGEFLALTSEQGRIMDAIYFDEIPINCSFGRSQENKCWAYFDTPTPAASNGNSCLYTLSQAVIYNSQQSLNTVSLDSESDSMYYTDNGDDPKQGNPYVGAFSVSPTTTIRALGSGTTIFSCYPSTRLYYEEEDYQLPVLSLSMNDEDLYGQTGIYTKYSSSGVDWERPVSLSYYDEGFKWSANSGIRIQGSSSVSMAKKSFRLFFRSGYGNKKLKASPFVDNDDNFSYLVLRSGYDDDITTSQGTLLRDPFSAELWKDMGEIATSSSFASLFLNNRYWGIYNIRESINEDFIKTKLYHSDFDLIRFQKTGTDLKYGAMDSWNEMWHLFQTADFTQEQTYSQVKEIIDMDALLNLLSFVHCTQFRSWTWGTFAIKPKGGKWTWTIWDTDRSFEMLNWNGFTEYAYTRAEKWSNLIPQKLVKNSQFKDDLVNRICDHLNTQFKESESVAVYDSLVNLLAPDISLEYERWNAENQSKWDVNNEAIRTFLSKRPDVLYDQMKTYFGISDTVSLALNIEGEGTLDINSLSVNGCFSGIYMEGVPVHIEAKAAPGYIFDKWKEREGGSVLDVLPEDIETLTAVFTLSSSAYTSLVINEIMYHPLDDMEDEWVEIYNPNLTAVDVSLWQLKDSEDDNYFVFPQSTVVGPEDYLVICRDIARFQKIYPECFNVIGSYGDGENSFKLSNTTDEVRLVNKDNEIEDEVCYYESKPWDKLADGKGPSLQLKDFFADNSISGNWGCNVSLLATPGVQNAPEDLVLLDEIEDSSFSIVPNPVTGGVVQISFPPSVGVTVNLYNLSGTMVFNKRFSYVNLETKAALSLPDVNSGVYLLKVTTNTQQTIVTKLVVQ